MESEPFGLIFRTPESWKPIVSDFASLCGCNGTGVAVDQCLMALSADVILHAQVRAMFVLLR
jgi:hypothetical protein